MKKSFRLFSMIMIASLIVLSAVSGMDNVEAATTGVWVLKKHYDVQTPGETTGWSYDLSYDYDAQKGLVTHGKEVKLTNVDGSFSCIFTGSCSIPKSTLKAGEDLKLNVTSSVSGNTLDGMICPNNCFVKIKDYELYFKDIKDSDHYYISSTTGPDYKKYDSATVSYKVYEGKEYGEEFIVEFQQSSGSTTSGIISTFWVYEWTKAPDTSIKAPARAVVKSLTSKRKTLTVNVKKIKKNCKGYEFQISRLKKFSSSTKKTASGTKVTFKKLKAGKKYYVRVRAFNKKNGKKKYGKWSKVKKITIRK